MPNEMPPIRSFIDPDQCAHCGQKVDPQSSEMSAKELSDLLDSVKSASFLVDFFDPAIADYKKRKPYLSGNVVVIDESSPIEDRRALIAKQIAKELCEDFFCEICDFAEGLREDNGLFFHPDRIDQDALKAFLVSLVTAAIEDTAPIIARFKARPEHLAVIGMYQSQAVVIKADGFFKP